MASQCGPDSTKFLQWHSSVGLFQISFSSGVPVHPASIRWVAQWYPSVHWVNQWHSSVHWTSQCTLAQGKGSHHTGNVNTLTLTCHGYAMREFSMISPSLNETVNFQSKDSVVFQSQIHILH